MAKLRESARDCPHCMSCGLDNPNGDLLALAHSNALEDGRGAYHKSPDIYGAIVCQRCHDRFDGRTDKLPKSSKRLLHKAAWTATIRWWIEKGYVGELK